jgi:ABC-type transport system involved in multi-copper enzyme maturation permease subunit
MFLTLIKKELTQHVLSYRFIIAVLLCFILILTSVTVMLGDYKQRLVNYSVNLPKDNEGRAIKPPETLSIFAKGLDEGMCRSFDISWLWGAINPTSKSQQVNVLFAFFATPDFAYIVKAVVSLLAILFAFDAISGEQEHGTLRLILSNSVSRGSLLLSKLVGGYVSLILPFALASLFGALFVSLSPNVSLRSDEWARLFLIFLVSLGYIAMFFSLGTLISSMTKTAASSAVILLFLWTIIVFAIPNAGSLVARQIAPIPSVQKLEEEKTQTWTAEIFKLTNGQTPSLQEAWDGIYDRFVQLEGDYRNKLNRLTNLSQNLCRLSPAASYIYIATALAQTGIADEYRYKQAVLRYRTEVFEHGGDYRGARIVRAKNSVDKQPPCPPLEGGLRFFYRRLTLPESIQAISLDAAAIIAFTVLFFMGAYLAFLRYDVR